MVITIIIIFIIIINAMHQRCIQTVSFVLFKKKTGASYMTQKTKTRQNVGLPFWDVCQILRSCEKWHTDTLDAVSFI